MVNSLHVRKRTPRKVDALVMLLNQRLRMLTSVCKIYYLLSNTMKTKQTKKIK